MRRKNTLFNHSTVSKVAFAEGMQRPFSERAIGNLNVIFVLAEALLSELLFLFFPCGCSDSETISRALVFCQSDLRLYRHTTCCVWHDLLSVITRWQHKPVAQSPAKTNVCSR